MSGMRQRGRGIRSQSSAASPMPSLNMERSRSSDTNKKQQSESKSLSAPNPEPAASKERSECIWPFYLCLEANYAKSFRCNECGDLPRETHAFVCEMGNIYCEYCINLLISTQNPCKANGQVITSKTSGLVVDNLTKAIRVKCPHCEESQIQDANGDDDITLKWNQSRQSSLSQNGMNYELKMEQIDDDDNNIRIPPYPTNAEQFQYHEGVDDHQIQGIAAAALPQNASASQSRCGYYSVIAIHYIHCNLCKDLNL